MFCVNFWNSLSFFCFRFLQYISNIFGCRFIIFAYFISVFIRVFSFVCILNRFACYSRDYHRSFVFACFLVIIASWVIYTYLDCAAKLVLFGVRLSSARTARRWYERCERVRILRVFKQNTSDVRSFFTINQFLQVLSCQIKTTHCPLPDANLVITWSRNLHAKIPIPGHLSKSGLIGVWHKDNLYLGTSTIGSGKPPTQRILIHEWEV